MSSEDNEILNNNLSSWQTGQLITWPLAQRGVRIKQWKIEPFLILWDSFLTTTDKWYMALGGFYVTLKGSYRVFCECFFGVCFIYVFLVRCSNVGIYIYKQGKERSQWCERVLSDSLFISTWYILFFLAIKGNGPLVDMDPQGETVLVWVFQPNEHFPAITLVTILLVESGSKSYYIQKLVEPYLHSTLDTNTLL